MHELLERLYRLTLDRCSPAAIARAALPLLEETVDLVTLGKCAVPLVEGARQRLNAARSLVVVPRGYATASPPDAEIVTGGHPDLEPASFAAGARLYDFAASAHRPVVLLISGGASACAEMPLAPWFSPEELSAANAWLVRSGLAIESMNVVRKHLSAIKGGRLGTLLPPGSRTFIYSDVDPDFPSMVASGPTLADPTSNADAASLLDLAPLELRPLARRLRDPRVPETLKSTDHPWTVLADNRLLIRTAAELARDAGLRVRQLHSQITGDVEEAANFLAREADSLQPGEALVAGGEPTVRVRGSGRGGRCSELAIRFARQQLHGVATRVDALFGSSDGVDGNSGAAGAVVIGSRVTTLRLSDASVVEAIANSDTFRLIPAIGRPLATARTVNNLRDIIMLARA